MTFKCWLRQRERERKWQKKNRETWYLIHCLFLLLFNTSSCSFWQTRSLNGDFNGIKNRNKLNAGYFNDVHSRVCCAWEAKTLWLHIDNMDTSLAVEWWVTRITFGHVEMKLIKSFSTFSALCRCDQCVWTTRWGQNEIFSQSIRIQLILNLF